MSVLTGATLLVGIAIATSGAAHGNRSAVHAVLPSPQGQGFRYFPHAVRVDLLPGGKVVLPGQSGDFPPNLAR